MIRRNATENSLPETIPEKCCLAKSRVKDGITLPGRTVEEHCRITGAVAKALLDALAPCTARLFPENSDLVVSLHDVGKLSPYFQAMIHGAVHCPQLFSQLEPFRNAPNPLSHAAVSRAALMPLSLSVAKIAGRHHGTEPEVCSANDSVCGDRNWQDMRLALISRLCEGRALPTKLSREQTALLTGFTAVADWIASGSLFDDPAEDWRPLITRAVAEAGFRPISFVRGLSFEDIFGFTPNAVQKAMIQAVRGPGVYALEAPMGVGKTEAALFAAYTLLAAGKAGGLYFALPTRLTSNKIFERLTPFLRATLAAESQNAATLLLHGASWLYATHEENRGEETQGECASSWFEQSKRGLLAPFGAGTLDQALMSVINVRHSAVRSFGLAGKVVILDEVHSYDAYTGTLLDALVRHLRKLGCTVILLSATLTRSRLARILDCEHAGSNAYPPITATYSGEETTVSRTLAVPESEAPQEADVRLRTGVFDEEAVAGALLRAEQGQQILWIENSVAEAQATFRLFAARASGMNIEVGLLHSSFTPSDRQKNEARWTSLYGKNSEERRLFGRILVGTQVLEQSLDIDADFLVTRLCPTDMLLQRMGRLWRHENTMRPDSARREAWILSPPLDSSLASPDTAFGVSGVIYSPYVLARTLEVWNDRELLTLPADIRPMLEATYEDRHDEPSPGMADAKRELRRRVQNMRALALSGQSDGRTLNEQAASTRMTEDETCPVLLVRSLSEQDCVLADGQSVRLDRTPETRLNVSAALFANIVRIRQKSASFTQSVNVTERWRRLFSFYLPVRKTYESLYLARIRPDDSLEDLCTPGQSRGRYTSRTGWEKEDLP